MLLFGGIAPLQPIQKPQTPSRPASSLQGVRGLRPGIWRIFHGEPSREHRETHDEIVGTCWQPTVEFCNVEIKNGCNMMQLVSIADVYDLWSMFEVSTELTVRDQNRGPRTRCDKTVMLKCLVWIIKHKWCIHIELCAHIYIYIYVTYWSMTVYEYHH